MHLETARMPGTSDRSDIPKKPYEGKRRLCNIVDVRFEHILQTESFDCGELILRPGTALVVQTPKGPQLAKAVSLPRRELVDRTHQQRVIRIATKSDVERAEQLAQDAKNGMREALMCVREQKLPMKLVGIEYMLDRSRALVYFTSEQRVDFRALVRDLAKALRVRIEMRQIGVRDGTGIIGGIGPCGHELCCSSFLRSFKNVSIRAPKSQGITLNPQRITGMCGRLKCCLLYEKTAYSAARPFAPRRDKSVLTTQGPGTIMSVNALSRTLHVRFPGGSSATVHMRDVVVLDVTLSHAELQATLTREEEVLARRRQRSSAGQVAEVSFELSADEYLWDDLETPLTFFGTQHQAPKKKEKDAQRARTNADAPRDENTIAQKRPKKKEDEPTQKTKRRRRRKPRKATIQAQSNDGKTTERSSAPKTTSDKTTSSKANRNRRGASRRKRAKSNEPKQGD